MSRAALALFAALAFALLLNNSFRHGWTRMESDFPNYYTAARLTLQHQPLRSFYDWEWFQRQIDYAGIGHQLGGYTPFTPLTMMPMVPLARLAPLEAKRAWLLLELLFLGAAIWILARLTKLSLAATAAVAMLAYTALGANLLLGQYYLFLLFLIACAIWCLLLDRPFTGGVLMGVIFALKLYTAPFALYFAVRRQWRALAGMLISIVALTLFALAVFGFPGVWHFAATVFPRAADGSINDPYSPQWSSMTALLRRLFVMEPEQNPHPAIDAPAAFFFLRSLYRFGIAALAVLVVARRKEDESHMLAWFFIALIALAPNTTSYRFVMLIAPVLLLLRGAPWPNKAILLALYAALELPVYSWDLHLYPKAWLMLALFLFSGWPYLSKLRPKPVILAMACVAALSAGDAFRQIRVSRLEPSRQGAQIIADPDGVFSSAPAAGVGFIAYEAIAQQRYLLRLTDARGLRTLPFDGEALHPTLTRSGAMYFELVSGSRSRICLFDGRLTFLSIPQFNPTEPAISPDGSKLAFISGGSLFVRTGELTPRVMAGSISNPAFFPDNARIAFADGAPGRRIIESLSLLDGVTQTLVAGGDAFQPAVSPDGATLAFVLSETGGSQIWLQDLATGARRKLTGGACNNDRPAWETDSRSIVFASDCNRGVGLPALYRIPVAQSQ